VNEPRTNQLFSPSTALAPLFAPALVVLLAGSAPAITFSIGANFEGTDLNAAFGLGSASIPPDTMGAVGPSHVAEIINTSFAVYNKTGTLQSRVSHDSFWDTAFSQAGNSGFAPNNTFDPRILYDDNTDRWYAAAVDSSQSASSRVLVGVTTGNDPSLSNWRAFEIDADSDNTRWADFPTMGINNDGLYISNNMFDNPGGSLESTNVTFMGIPLSSLTAGTPSIAGFQIQENIDPNTTGFALQPAVDLDGGSNPNPLLSAFNKPSGFLKASDVPTDFFTTGTINTTGGFIGVTSRNAPPDIDQPGSKQDIDAGDNRFSGNVVLQQIPGRANPSLWAVHSVEINGRAAIEWYEIDSVTDAVLQSGTISDPSLAFNYPSIAVNDDGDVVIGFSGGDPSTSISTYVAVGETVAGTTTFDPFVQTFAGTGDYERLDTGGRNRWGDYSATVLDPSDPKTFWTFQEYVDGTDNWAVRITELNIAIGADTVISVDTGATPTPIDLGTVLVGATPSGNVELDKTGSEATTFDVQISSAGLTDNASGNFAGGVQTEIVALSLVSTEPLGSATAGDKLFQVTIDNTATGSAASGQGSDDPNDVFDVMATVLDHAEGSFSNSVDLDTLNIDFGNVLQGSSPADINFDIFNLVQTASFTAGLDLDSITPSGDTSKFSTNLSLFSNLAAGGSNSFLASFTDTSQTGSFAATITLGVSDQDLPGATAGNSLILNITGNVIGASAGVIPEPSSFLLLCIGGAAMLSRHRKRK